MLSNAQIKAGITWRSNWIVEQSQSMNLSFCHYKVRQNNDWSALKTLAEKKKNYYF